MVMEKPWKLVTSFWLRFFFSMNKKNYKDEAFVHIVSIMCTWPLALRETLRINRTISLSGRSGHELADDEFIEERLVRRTKMYVKKQATVNFNFI